MKQIMILMFIILVLILIACSQQITVCDCPDYEVPSCGEYQNLVDRKYGLDGCDEICSKPVCVDFTNAEMNAVRQAQRAEAERQAFEEKIANFELENCWNTSDGWECNFDVQTYLDKVQYEEGNLSAERQKEILNETTALILKYETKCREEGGVWRQPRYMGIILFHRFCHFPFSDAETICTSSNQCQGLCTLDKFYVREKYISNDTQYIYDEELDPEHRFPTHINCEDNCTGTCAELPYVGEGYGTRYTVGLR